jgi:formate-dependent nitrite reductase membrane component NrfD
MMIMKAQHKWHWDHAVYFFLGGMGAGAFIIGAIADIIGGEWVRIAPIGIWLGFPCVLIGALILFAFLGTPMNAIHSWKRPGTSWISRGIFILTIFMILGAIYIAFWQWPFGSVLQNNPGGRHVIGVLGIIFALGVMMYTGFLLGANRPIAFWSNPMLPLVFFLSALYTGILAILLIASLSANPPLQPIGILGRIIILLSVLQLFVLVFLIQGSHRYPEARASVSLLMGGSVTVLFWFWVVLVGLLVPLVLELANHGGGPGLHVIAAILGLIGSLCLRQTILASGVFAPLKAGRFEYNFPQV